ncbi:Hsp20/alpha crystallin family protein [Chloroflexia bacterium SDU3-3]|nr:Hsp20/alpha crystallin family protein [Chloroflexia bacterium SDU3-3]
MTSLNRWDPVQDMMTLREAMQQLFEDSVVSPAAAPRRPGAAFAPAMDLSETKDAFVVEAAVPGLKPEDLDITVENNVLTIRGEVKQDQESKERSYHRVERRFGAFQRSISLPTTVNAEGIRASLEHGVLNLVIPKAEALKPRKISVSVGAGQPELAASNN